MTALPAGVRVEEDLAEGVVLWDVSKLLPHAHRRATRRPAGIQILRLYLHNSGALGLPGVAGAVSSARFVMRARGFPWWPYHFWFCRDALRDVDGRLVVLRLAPDEERTWSQGAKANDHGVSGVLQGNTSRLPVSPAQVEALEAWVPWAEERYGFSRPAIADWLATHSRAGRFGGRSKSTCPGTNAELWRDRYVERATVRAA